MPSESPRILIAPDSFKGTFSAVEVAAAIGRGVERAGARADLCPAADGGEGTLAALREPLGLEIVNAPANDALGRPLEAHFGINAESGLAVLEIAAASGLTQIASDERDAWAASTSGTGELIVAARECGARSILVGVGGSATTHGGAGALAAIERAGGLGAAELTVLCDVETPFELAAEVFAPQKGAGPEQVAELTARLEELAAHLPRDPRGVPMSGCAGGLSGGLWAGLGAKLVPGAEWVLDAVDFDARVVAATAVVTGEGRLDEQTLDGKLIAAIAARSRGTETPLHAIVGSSALDEAADESLGLASVQIAGDLEQIEAAGARLRGA